MERLLLALLLAIFLVSGDGTAKPLAKDAVPEPLKPWVDWVLLDHPEYRCPFLYNSFATRRCGWPSRLELDLQNRDGRFEVIWNLFLESTVVLPGDEKNWPMAVSANGKPATVGERKGRPVVTLAPGEHRITGLFQWDRIPESLTIPADTGIIALKLRGKPVPSPHVNGDRLWLRESDSGRQVRPGLGNTLDIQVFRRVLDDVPLRVITRLDLKVAGDQREELVGRVLLPEFVPMGLDSPIPARLEPDGRLTLQVRPGHWQIEMTARHPREILSFAMTPSPTPWPESEIWSFDARSHIRLVEVDGVSPIDPTQTNLPSDWKHLPAYRMWAGDVLRLKVIRRGDPEPEPNSLTLRRTLWLDFDGTGYTINDHIAGTMSQGWRLEANPGMRLGRVVLDGRPQLLTRAKGTDRVGVEVRRGSIALSADSRIEGSTATLGAVGWDQDFQRVSAQLNLPPGWRLLSAVGADNAPDTWLYRWTLLDLFILMIAALAFFRLWNVWWGLCALVTLALVWHEPGAPRFVWLNILAAIALLRVLPEGKLRVFVTIYRNAFLIGLVVIIVPFMISQVRNALYPQLEHRWRPIVPYGVGATREEPVSPESVDSAADIMSTKPMMPKAPPSKSPAARTRLPENKAQSVEEIDPNAIVQTGPGLPRWKWNTVELNWNGPVAQSQQLKLIYLSPELVKVTNFIRVILVLALSLRLLGMRRPGLSMLSTGSARALPMILVASLAFGIDDVAADIPEPALLKELQTRLLAPPDCLPECAQIVLMNMSVDSGIFRIRLAIHTSDDVAVPLPGSYSQWQAERVQVDKTAPDGLFRDADGNLWVHLKAGRHLLRLEGALPERDDFLLSLPVRPHKVEIAIPGWRVEGIGENGVPEGQQLRLTRLPDERSQTASLNAEGAETLPAFAHVERTLRFGLNWRIRNRVVRVSPRGVPIILKVPLLPGESVTTDNVRVQNGEVLVNMPADAGEMAWDSVLEKTSTLTLAAPRTTDWTEIWRADVSPLWHMETEGIAVVHHQDIGGHWLPEWRPWPGESVILHVSHPDAVEGRTLTIDESRLDVSPGKRATDLTLRLLVRAAMGGLHTVTLPESGRLNRVVIDGAAQPIRQKAREVTLPIRPGAQEITLAWIEPAGLRSWFEVPAVDIASESVNSTVHVTLGDDRWVLFTGGARMGPAVLFWGILVVIVMLSLVLGRIDITPLRSRHWFLLLIGLSQVPVAAAVLVVGWLILLGLRGRQTRQMGTMLFNAQQLGLALLTVLALVLLFVAIKQGLLGTPDMQIEGNQSTAYHLNWYRDRSLSELPTPWVLSVPRLAYQLLMLAWALWLASALLNWLKWGWSCFSSRGFWRKTEKKSSSVAPRQPTGKSSESALTDS